MTTRSKVVWTSSEIEQLITWMEHNKSSISGNQTIWMKKMKQEVFEKDKHISWNRIRDKVRYLQTLYKAAVGDKSNLCPYFSRLDTIWREAPDPDHLELFAGSSSEIPAIDSDVQMQSPSTLDDSDEQSVSKFSSPDNQARDSSPIPFVKNRMAPVASGKDQFDQREMIRLEREERVARIYAESSKFQAELVAKTQQEQIKSHQSTLSKLIESQADERKMMYEEKKMMHHDHEEQRKLLHDMLSHIIRKSPPPPT
jgi:hypothetical protein